MSDINIHKIVSGVTLDVKYADVDTNTDLWFKCIVTKVNGYGNNEDGHYIDVDVEFEDGEEVENECFYEHLYNVDGVNGWRLLDNENNITDDEIPIEGNYNDPANSKLHAFQMVPNNSDNDTDEEDINEEDNSDDTSVDLRPALGAFERGFNSENDDIPNSIKVTLAICMGAFAGIISLAAYGFYQQYIACPA